MAAEPSRTVRYLSVRVRGAGDADASTVSEEVVQAALRAEHATARWRIACLAIVAVGGTLLAYWAGMGQIEFVATTGNSGMKLVNAGPGTVIAVVSVICISRVRAQVRLEHEEVR